MKRTWGWVSSDRKGVAAEIAIKAFSLSVQNRYSAVHCAHVLTVPTALVIRLFTGAKVLVYAHGSEFTSGHLNGLKIRAYKAADVVVANSSATKAHLITLGIAPASIRVVNPGVDVNRFVNVPDSAALAFRASVGISASATVLVSVGRLHPNARHKGFDTSIDITRRLADRNEDVHLLIVGSGADRARLESHAEGQRLSHRVHFLGGVSDAELAVIYASSDLFLLPSRREPVAGGYTVEGFGLVFLEAAASGLPAISTRLGGAVDAIVDGVTGVLTNTDEVQELVRTIETLVRDPAVLEEMGRAARDRAKFECGWPHAARRVCVALEAQEGDQDE